MIKKQSGSKQRVALSKAKMTRQMFAIYVNSLSECIKATGKGVKIVEVSTVMAKLEWTP